MLPSGKNIHRREDATNDDEWGVIPNPGFEVWLSPEKQFEILRYRNLRDRKNIGAKVENELKKVEDPQIVRAVEYFKSLKD